MPRIRREKYDPLYRFLRSQDRQLLSMSFSEIEDILGFKLPPSSRKHRSFWSNAVHTAAVTESWLKAGYVTADIDLQGERLNFIYDPELAKEQLAKAGLEMPSSLNMSNDENSKREFKKDIYGVSSSQEVGALWGMKRGMIVFKNVANLCEINHCEEEKRVGSGVDFGLMATPRRGQD